MLSNLYLSLLQTKNGTAAGNVPPSPLQETLRAKLKPSGQ